MIEYHLGCVFFSDEDDKLFFMYGSNQINLSTHCKA